MRPKVASEFQACSANTFRNRSRPLVEVTLDGSDDQNAPQKAPKICTRTAPMEREFLGKSNLQRREEV